MEEQRIIVTSIIEVIGKPKDHINNLLHQYIDKLKKEKGIRVLKENYSPPEERPDKLFGTFVDLELTFDSFDKVVWFTFDYRPASLEIVEPDQLLFDIQQANDYLNDVLGKLHNIDMLLTNIAGENKLLKDNGIVVAKNFIKHILRQGKKSQLELIKDTGIPENMLVKFLHVLEKEEKIKKEGEYYQLA
ncbi:hypothetical protein HYY69_07915 [Candidatus Woesearchaeota archaeon]|nr:hypothetical protein [Candidatus Woesearchaeota archaeon]